MKFTLNWLKDHLDFNESLEVILKALTDLGVEVEHVENYIEKLEQFSVAYIQKAHSHPNADKLKVCQVITNDGERQVVCGAPNAREGIYVIYAPIGSYIPGNDVFLKSAEIRGVNSEGMMLSERELQISDNHDSIIEFATGKLGENATIPLGLDDIVIDVSLTPNRGDLLGVRGIAKDLQAFGIGKLKAIQLQLPTTKDKTNIKITANSQVSEKFVIQKITEVKNQESPAWLKNRLKLIGFEPRSALIDITNYICIDLNQPLHCYDSDKINDHSSVTIDLSKKTDFIALDDNKYKLSNLSPIISFASDIACIAGIKGSKHTSVDINTQNILLEAAHFDAKTVALGARELSISTDSSYRFERGIDIESIEIALQKATSLIAEICGGIFAVPASVENIHTKKPIIVNIEYIQQMTGLQLEAKEIQTILKGLSCELSYKDNKFTVVPPSYRNDIDNFSVILSEIIRINGLDALPSVSTTGANNEIQKVFTPLFSKTTQARKSAAGLGLLETISMSFISQSLAQDFNILNQDLILDNPISSELSIMRNSLLPSLMQLAKYNINNSYINQRIFELANIYHNNHDYEMSLAFLLCGNSYNKNWKHSEVPYDVWDAKALIFRIIEDLGLKTSSLLLQQADGLPSYYHPTKSAKLAMGKYVIAYFGELHPAILEKQNISQPLYAGEAFLERLPSAKNKIVKNNISLSNLMPVTRDFAFLVAKSVKASELIKLIKANNKKLITDVSIFDVYEDDKLGEDQKSVAFTVTLQAHNQTLTEAEIKVISDKIVASLQKSLNAVLRTVN